MNQNEWEIRESQRQRELEEARGRAQQMEKTMKWFVQRKINRKYPYLVYNSQVVRVYFKLERKVGKGLKKFFFC